MSNTSSMGEHAGEKKMPILPFYLLLDESGSMKHKRIEAINAVVPKLHQALCAHPAVSDVVRVGLIAFSTQPTTVVELADLAELTQIPGLGAQGATNYGAAFAHLRRTIEIDVAALRADGYPVHRPTVFFMSDGEPTDGGWEDEHARLVDPNWPLHPNVIAFGIVEASAAVIKKVATLAAYMQDSGVEAPDAIAIWVEVLLQSMMRSAGAGALVVPNQITGFHQVGASQVA